MKNLRKLWLGLLISFLCVSGFAQTGPPPLPPTSLATWYLDDTNLDNLRDEPPLAFTNLNFVSSWLDSAVSLDTNAVAVLDLPIYATNGNYTNVTFSNGSISLWVQMNWTSTNDGGTGPGNWSPLFEIGQYTSNNLYGGWTLAISPDGNTLAFVTQTNGSGEVHIETPIVWDESDWHNVVITYSPSNSALYLEGSLVTNTSAILYWPGPDECSNGFFLGSDPSGTLLAHAQFQLLETYDVPLTADFIAANYASTSNDIIAWGGTVPYTGGFHTDANPPNPGTNTNSYTFTRDDFTPYSTNAFWLETLPLGTNAFNTNADAVTFILFSTTNTSTYQLWSAATLTNAWAVEQTFVGASGQNWTPLVVSMTNRPTLFFQAINYSQDTTEGGLPDWWKILYGLDPNSVSSSTNGISDAYADPMGDGWSNLQKFENGWNPNVFHTPPAPMVTVIPQSGDTGVTISWQPNQGAVTGYTIFRNGSAIATVSSNVFSYQDNSVGVSYLYQVRANYAGGNSSLSAAQDASDADLAVTVILCRGPQGQPYLMAPNIPKGVTEIQFIPSINYTDWPFPLFDVYSQPITNFVANLTEYYFNLAVTNFTNGRYAVPVSLLPYFSGYTLAYYPLGTNGAFGPGEYVSPNFLQSVPLDSSWATLESFYLWQNVVPFMDGTAHLQQNLAFQLESADESGAFQFTVNAVGDTRPSDGPVDSYSGISFLTNYAYANFHQSFPGYPAFVNEFRPFEDNYFYRNFVVVSNQDLFATNGALASGIYYDASLPGGDPYNIQAPSRAKYAFEDYAYALLCSTNATPTAIPTMLTTNAQWIYSPWPEAGNIGVSFVGSTNITLASGQFNNFGLDYQSVLETYSDGTSLYSQTLSPGNVVYDSSIGYSSPFFYAKVAAPQLNTIGYFFGVANRDYLPGDPGFNPTNNTGPMIAAVGSPLLIGAWAEQEIVNGNGNQRGFLELYFDKAFAADASGSATTNQTGVLSEYGEFFPTDPGLALLNTKTNAGAGQGQVAVAVIGLYTDLNHDGVIDTSFSGPDFATPDRPFRFWVNDDNDSGDTGGNDIPGYPADHKNVPNGLSGVINGQRDLIDFFPVYVDIASVVRLMQTNTAYAGLQFRLSQPDGALNFLYASLETNASSAYLGSLASGYIPSSVTQIPSTGIILSNSFVLNTTNTGGGMLLVEAWTNTTSPLVLDVLDGGQVIAEAQLPLSITGVEQMFRHKNLTGAITGGAIDGPGDRLTYVDAPNAPDDNGTNFIFLHGYNVNPNQARGWQSEMFKRLYWSGSHARFYGVTWKAYDTQQFGVVTLNLQTNILHAFQTASSLNTFLNSLSGTNVLMAHSLGNMLGLSAINDYTNTSVNTFFMVDAAVALEAIDGTNAINTNMVPPDWLAYANRVWASEWFNLFSGGDARSQLTWSNRLANFNGTQVYNFYSSGEEVLRNYTGAPTNLTAIAEQAIIASFWSNTPFAANLWVEQEKEKGRMTISGILSSTHGGWGYNTNYGTIAAPPSNSIVVTLTSSQLQTNPVFNTDYDGLLFGGSGSTYAAVNRNAILSDAIPALSWATGANAVPDAGIVQQNINMQTSFETGWPASKSTGTEAFFWYHSDLKVVAYPYNHDLFDTIVSAANLK